ncbi:hypothetical protein EOPP23_21320 [Endozoicomonas sp. OPT23]|uniref:hypothetical protein n=1 Tax=Endozoicomonas sp. OPT23 TaxID=2072845 RepID=UPI00129A1A36|nr:hypothetical protein [Endozoicomonas sp. OPT23]MRI35503.1 hypothetical protein [Endozoicomonas sp. OPT23]
MKYFSILALLVFSIASNAEVIKSEKWNWDLSHKDYAYAATINDTNRILGQYCYYADSTCYYLVSLGITCETGDEYPSLINTDSTATTINLICGHKYNNENVFFIKPFDQIDKIVKKSNKVGFAVAMENGEFKVVRFSLNGSSKAIENMLLGAEAIKENKSVERKVSELYL